jgi:hypothetical protein
VEHSPQDHRYEGSGSFACPVHQHVRRDFLQQGRKFVSECVPKNFAYFHVEFGLSSGFIHVIDDEQEFPRTFGADVVAGVLEIPGEVIARLKRKPAQEVMDDAAVCRCGLAAPLLMNYAGAGCYGHVQCSVR